MRNTNRAWATINFYHSQAPIKYRMYNVIIEFLIKHQILITLLSNILTAFGTVGAVSVALYFNYKESKPKLRVFATLGIVFPEQEEHVWASCINMNKQSIVCTGFVFNPNRFRRRGLSFLLVKEVRNLPNDRMPKTLQFSERLEKRYEISTLTNNIFKSILGKYKFIAKIKLKFFWRIVVNTNIKEFRGKLSNSLIEKIINFHYF